MSDPNSALYARQRALSEVGDAGQRRLCETRVALHRGDAAHYIAGEYLGRAGLRVSWTEPGEAADGASAPFEHRAFEHSAFEHRAFEHSAFEHSAFEHSACFRHQAARELGAGAWLALSQIRTALLELSQEEPRKA